MPVAVTGAGGSGRAGRRRLRLAFASGGKADFAPIGERLACVCGIGGQLTLTDPALTRAVAYEVPGSDAETSITVGGGRVWLLLEGGTVLGIDPAAL